MYIPSGDHSAEIVNLTFSLDTIPIRGEGERIGPRKFLVYWTFVNSSRFTKRGNFASNIITCASDGDLFLKLHHRRLQESFRGYILTHCFTHNVHIVQGLGKFNFFLKIHQKIMKQYTIIGRSDGYFDFLNLYNV